MPKHFVFDTVTKLQHAFHGLSSDRENNLLPALLEGPLAFSILHDVEAVIFIGPKDAHENWSAAKAVLAVNGKPAWRSPPARPVKKPCENCTPRTPRCLRSWRAGPLNGSRVCSRRWPAWQASSALAMAARFMLSFPTVVMTTPCGLRWY